MICLVPFTFVICACWALTRVSAFVSNIGSSLPSAVSSSVSDLAGSAGGVVGAGLLKGVFDECSKVKDHGDSVAGSNFVNEQAASTIEGLLDGFLRRQPHYPVNVDHAPRGSIVPLEEILCLRRTIGSSAKEFMDTVIEVKVQLGKLVSGGGVDGVALLLLPSRIQKMVSFGSQLGRCCELTHVLDAFHVARTQITNISHIANRFLVHGADITHEILAMIPAAKKSQYRNLGEHVGRVWRHILLAKAGPGWPKLSGEMIQLSTLGLFKGFFGRGTTLDIDSAVGDVPAVHAKIDLHNCLAANAAFLGTMWSTIWLIVVQGKLALGSDAGSDTSSERRRLSVADAIASVQQNSGNLPVTLSDLPLPLPKLDGAWIGALSAAFLEFPAAIQTCGLPSEMLSMVWDGTGSLSKLHMALNFPHTDAANITIHLSGAISAFTHHHWSEFGTDLGALLKDVLVSMYPQLYSVDDRGSLRKLLQLSKAESTALRRESRATTGVVSSSVLSLVGALLAAAGFLVFLKARKAFFTGRGQRQLGPDGYDVVHYAEEESDIDAAAE